MIGPAERARTLLATSTSVEIGVLNESVPLHRHAVDARGALLFAAPDTTPDWFAVVGSRLPATRLTATAVDVSPVPQSDRVRGTLRLTGPVSVAPDPLPAGVAEFLSPSGAPAERVLRLVPERVGLDWRCERDHDPAGAEASWRQVDVREYAAAPLDPLLGWESRWLVHLVRDHAELLPLLAGTRTQGNEVVRPILVDRLGLVLRVYDDGRHRDVRLAMGREVRCGCDASEAFRDLVHQRLSRRTR